MKGDYYFGGKIISYLLCRLHLKARVCNTTWYNAKIVQSRLLLILNIIRKIRDERKLLLRRQSYILFDILCYLKIKDFDNVFHLPHCNLFSPTVRQPLWVSQCTPQFSNPRWFYFRNGLASCMVVMIRPPLMSPLARWLYHFVTPRAMVGFYPWSNRT